MIPVTGWWLQYRFIFLLFSECLCVFEGFVLESTKRFVLFFPLLVCMLSTLPLANGSYLLPGSVL
jgi:hypothetical protein